MKSTLPDNDTALGLFKTYILSKANITDGEFEKVRQVSTVKNLRKRQYLLQEGDVWQHYAFVCQGCLHTYHVDDKGTEHIMRFSIENWWPGERESLIANTPSRYNIDALEDSTLIMIRKDDFDQLCHNIPAFNNMVMTLINRSYIAAENRVKEALSYTTEERYQLFMEKFPDVFNRVPLHMIASYLGVSPERLSRIRSQFHKKP